MDQITMLGTGHAMTLSCFNTCFIYENENGKMLVDTGGGQQLLKQLQLAGTSVSELQAIFISHQHTDHLLGLPWIIRSLGGPNGREKPLEIYMHEELMHIARGMLDLILPDKMPGAEKNLRFITVHDGDQAEILGRPFTFFDTHSFKCSQYGFSMHLGDGRQLVFCGDVPFEEPNRQLIEGTDFLMHEAFSLESAPHRHGGPGGPMPPMPPMPGGPGGPGGPGKIGHSTVKGAAKIAEGLSAKTLILIHGSDDDLENRKRAYTEEASGEFSGKIFVPDDLDVIDLMA